MNIRKQVFVGMCIFLLLGKEEEYVSHMLYIYLTLKNAKLFSKVVGHLIVPPAVCQSSTCMASLPTVGKSVCLF